MKKISIYASLFLTASFLFVACNQNTKSKQRLAKIETPYGDMIVKLYDETPKHRDNFVKLVNDDFFNNTLFHRVINEFMIQGGDPDSKEATADQRLGNGDVGYKIDAEFKAELFHKKGVIAAAREGDRVNPKKASSGCQFYIVQGKVWNDVGLKNQETRINNRHKQNLFNRYFEEQMKTDSASKTERSQEELMSLINSKVQEQLNKETPFSIPEAHKAVYKEIGGTPHLDGSYTVFGEVIEGLHIIDSIAKVETNKYDRPLEDVKMKIKMLN